MANSDIHSTFFLGATAHLTNNTIIKITWKNDEPIWTEQWPLMKEKLQVAKQLIDTQLESKHIEESCSPWNSPIFVIKKKSNKWRLLTDLRKVNASMKPMGALQPGIPSSTTIPQNWHTGNIFEKFHFIILLVSCGISSKILNLLFLALSAHSLYHRQRFFI